jgi:hypothetical protein
MGIQLNAATTPEGARMGPTPKFCSIEDWVKLSGMGRRFTYERLTDGSLRAKKMGAKTLIDVEFGLNWLRSLPDAAFASPRRRVPAPDRRFRPAGRTEATTTAEA